MSQESKEQELEKGLDGKDFNEKIEAVKETLEGMKEKDIFSSSDVFKIVVENLKKKGFEIPNKNIYDIRRMYASKIEYVIIRFDNRDKTDTWIYISTNTDDIIAKINKDTYTLTDEQEKKYRERYLNYALMFLEERERVIKNTSDTATFRLENLGI